MTLTRVAIVGSREFPSMDKVRQYIWRLAARRDEVEIVSGGARGVDDEAHRMADLQRIKYTEFPADWETHGKSAGFIRNQQIVEYADRVVAFWDGESRGTRDTIERALKAHKHLEVLF